MPHGSRRGAAVGGAKSPVASLIHASRRNLSFFLSAHAPLQADPEASQQLPALVSLLTGLSSGNTSALSGLDIQALLPVGRPS